VKVRELQRLLYHVVALRGQATSSLLISAFEDWSTDKIESVLAELCSRGAVTADANGRYSATGVGTALLQILMGQSIHVIGNPRYRPHAEAVLYSLDADLVAVFVRDKQDAGAAVAALNLSSIEALPDLLEDMANRLRVNLHQGPETD